LRQESWAAVSCGRAGRCPEPPLPVDEPEAPLPVDELEPAPAAPLEDELPEPPPQDAAASAAATRTGTIGFGVMRTPTVSQRPPSLTQRRPKNLV
jgi:hypothetical protein